MGNSASAEKEYVRLIETLLKGAGIKVKPKNFEELFFLIKRHCCWFQPKGKAALNLEVWKQVMEDLRRAQQQGEPIPLSVWSLCNFISLALEPLQSDSEESSVQSIPQTQEDSPTDVSVDEDSTDHEGSTTSLDSSLLGKKFNSKSRKVRRSFLARQPLPSESEDFSDVQGSGLEKEADNRELFRHMEQLTQVVSKLVERLDVSGPPSMLAKSQLLPPPSTNPSAPPYEYKQPVSVVGPRGAVTQAILQGRNQGDPEAYKTPFGVCPVVVQEHPANEQYPDGYVQWHYQPLAFQVIKDLKHAVMSYGMQSSYVFAFYKDWQMNISLFLMTGKCCVVLFWNQDSIFSFKLGGRMRQKLRIG